MVEQFHGTRIFFSKMGKPKKWDFALITEQVNITRKMDQHDVMAA
jgi:hypothetical protein